MLEGDPTASAVLGSLADIAVADIPTDVPHLVGIHGNAERGQRVIDELAPKITDVIIKIMGVPMHLLQRCSTPSSKT